MQRSPDVIVVGLGAVGSATLQQLARRGVAVLGIDRFSPPHARGSSHGDTRITRLAIGEGAQAYTPLVRRSHEIWRSLETEYCVRLLRTNGCLVIQDPGPTSLHGSDDFLGTTIASAAAFGLPVQRLDGGALTSAFPQFALRGDERACFEPSGGYVRPERCIATQLEDGVRHGAAVNREETVLRVSGEGRGVVVETDCNSYRAGRCVLAAGPWIASLLPDAWHNTFTVYPQTLTWFAVKPDHAAEHSDEAMPVFVWAIRGGHVLYGVPAVDGSPHVKVATEQFTVVRDPADVASFPPEPTIEMCTSLVGPRLPGLGQTVRAEACMYTVTPDMGFVVDCHPDSDNIIIASACSGHGFKHSAGIGAAIAELIDTGACFTDLQSFNLSRFAPSDDVAPSR